jgi:prolyl 4-hydroxylase
MRRMCAPSCQACNLIDIRARCPPLGHDVSPGLLPGELNAMFERIVRTAPGNQSESVPIEEGMINYTVHVHSRPEPLDEDATEEESISFWRDLMQPPWTIAFDNFLSEEECNHLIQLGYTILYGPSEEDGEEQFSGTFDRPRSRRRNGEE